MKLNIKILFTLLFFKSFSYAQITKNNKEVLKLSTSHQIGVSSEYAEFAFPNRSVVGVKLKGDNVFPLVVASVASAKPHQASKPEAGT